MWGMAKLGPHVNSHGDARAGFYMHAKSVGSFVKVTLSNERDVSTGVFQKTMADEADEVSVGPEWDGKRTGEARSPRPYKQKCTASLLPVPEEGEGEAHQEDSTEPQGNGNCVPDGWTRPAVCTWNAAPQRTAT